MACADRYHQTTSLLDRRLIQSQARRSTTSGAARQGVREGVRDTVRDIALET